MASPIGKDIYGLPHAFPGEPFQGFIEISPAIETEETTERLLDSQGKLRN